MLSSLLRLFLLSVASAPLALAFTTAGLANELDVSLEESETAGEALAKTEVEVQPSFSVVTAPVLPLMPSGVQPASAEASQIEWSEDHASATSEGDVISPAAPRVQAAATLQRLDILIAGLKLGDRTIVPSTTIRGAEDGLAAIAFEQWQIPLDDVVQALQLSLESLENGELELRSPGLVTHLKPDELTTDAELGIVLSIADIESKFGVEAQFDIAEYVIQFEAPWEDLKAAKRLGEAVPVVTEGLPLIQPAPLGVSAVSQRINIAGRRAEGDRPGSRNTQGTLTGIGSALGGSVFTRVDQRDLADSSSWQLGELQYLRQTAQQDYVAGSQASFWRSLQQSGQYWGLTTVQRFGFEATASEGTGGFSPTQRLQANRIGRSVVGEAEPGTLVQLVQSTGSLVIDEMVVDSSGVYRFENIPTGQGGLGNRYQIWRYPNGLLTETPEIESATFSVLPGQLPKAASALILSGGFEQSRGGDRFVGRFGEFQGGAAYRRGLSESLTLGAGVALEGSPLVTADAFFVPKSLPLQAAVSAVVDTQSGEREVLASLRLKPSSTWNLNLESDRFAQRFDSTWQVTPGLALLASGNTRDEAIAGGASLFLGNRNFSLRGRATLDSRSRARWSLAAQSGAVSFRNNGNEVSTQSELLWNLSGSRPNSPGHALALSYDSRSLRSNPSQLAALSWNYRSSARSYSGSPLWNLQFGYGLGSVGSGPLASATLAVLPGIDLRARYQGVSTSSDQGTYSFELVPRFNLQGRQLVSNQQDKLRNQGGLLLQPFLDRNSDGLRTADEELLLNGEDLDLLFQINNTALKRHRPESTAQGLYITMRPGTQRLDLDPAGQPLNWRSTHSSYAIKTVAGQYTPVAIALKPSYTLSGRLQGNGAEALLGQRIEAIHQVSGRRRLSITNGAGVFYLEGLEQGEYRFEINGQPVERDSLSLDQQSDFFQELNLQWGNVNPQLSIEPPPLDKEG